MHIIINAQALACCLLLVCLTSAMPVDKSTAEWRAGLRSPRASSRDQGETLSRHWLPPWVAARRSLGPENQPSKFRFSSITFITSMCDKAAVTTPQAFAARWTGSSAGGQSTMESSMSDVSYGQISFSSSTNVVVAVNIPCQSSAFSTSTCTQDNLQAWISYGEGIASKAYDLSQFTHRIMLLPPGNPCSSSGLSTQSSMLAQGRSSVWVWLSDAVNLPIPSILHETGHTLGLRHAALYGSTWEQGDSSSVMGAVAPMRCFAAPSVWQLDWTWAMQDVSMDSLRPGSWWSGTLQPLGQDASFVRLLPGSTGGHTYFISYRTAVGCDTQLDQQFQNKLSVHIYDGGDIVQGTGLSYLVALITPGQQWAPARVDRPSKVIIQLTSAAGGAASISLCRYGSAPSECGPALAKVPAALPADQCNYNGSCETVFGENACSDCSRSQTAL